MSGFPVAHFPEYFPCEPRGSKFCEAFGCLHACDIEDGVYSFQHRVKDRSAYRLSPAGPCVPFLLPNGGSPICEATYEDYIRKSLVDRFTRTGVNVEQQVDECCLNYADISFGPLLDLVPQEDLAAIKEAKERKRKKPAVNQAQLLDQAMCAGVPRSLLYPYLQEELHGQINRMFHDQYYYGGCLSCESLSAKESDKPDCRGVLFYPSGPGLDTLNIHALGVESEEGMVPRYTPSPSSLHQLEVAGCIRQIDSRRSNRREMLVGVRCDYRCYVLQTKAKKASLSCSLIQDVTSQMMVTSMALSPEMDGEFLFSTDQGQIHLVDTSKKVLGSSAIHTEGTGAVSKPVPVYCHFASHPRLALAHSRQQAYQLDFRISNGSTPSEIPLFTLPSSCLPKDQYLCVARQHPSNPFYHHLATQHYLLLIDERFPQHSVLQWPHLLSSPPNYLHVTSPLSSSSPASCLPEDLLLAASHSSREVHCFQYSSLIGKTPCATRGPWKIQDNNEWLNNMSSVPGRSLHSVRKRVARPLVGMCAAKLEEDHGSSLTVFQISEAGDVYHQVLTVSNEDEKDYDDQLDWAVQDKLDIQTERRCQQFVAGVLDSEISGGPKKEFKLPSRKLKVKKTNGALWGVRGGHSRAEESGCCVCRPGKASSIYYSCMECQLQGYQSTALARAYPANVLTDPRRDNSAPTATKYRGMCNLVGKISLEDMKSPLGKRLLAQW